LPPGASGHDIANDVRLAGCAVVFGGCNRNWISGKSPGNKTVSHLFQNRHRFVTLTAYSFRVVTGSRRHAGAVSGDWFGFPINPADSQRQMSPVNIFAGRLLATGVPDLRRTGNPFRDCRWRTRYFLKIVNAMNKLLYEPHLVVREFFLSPGKEWIPKLSGWSLIQINSGTGYWLQEQSRTELETGTVLLMAGDRQGHVLASQLNAMSLLSFSVMPERLAGLITLGEQNFLTQAASRGDLAFQIFPAANPVALKMSGLCAGRNRGGLAFRLALLQLLVEALGAELERIAPGPENTDATQRLRLFLKETPQDALLEISFDELAQMTNCTSRHLSRIFFTVVGMSFSDKRAEIRLARARELLATSQSKVVEVALESGYKSLSLFNQMFTRRFGISPGRWRKKNGTDGAGVKNRRTTKRQRPAINQTRRLVF
jgi:AraC-like DNA-binding protein